MDIIQQIKAEVSISPDQSYRADLTDLLHPLEVQLLMFDPLVHQRMVTSSIHQYSLDVFKFLH